MIVLSTHRTISTLGIGMFEQNVRKYWPNDGDSYLGNWVLWRSCREFFSSLLRYCRRGVPSDWSNCADNEFDVRARVKATEKNCAVYLRRGTCRREACPIRWGIQGKGWSRGHSASGLRLGFRLDYSVWTELNRMKPNSQTGGSPGVFKTI